MGNFIGIRAGAVVEKDGQVEGLGGLVQVEKKMNSNARLKSMEKKSSQTAASKPNPQQERRRIRKEAKSSQCAGKRGGDRATSNVQCAKSMPRAGFTKIAIWQTSKKQR